MKDKQIIDSWNKIEPDNAADARILNAILERKCELYEKQEWRDVYLLCITQIAMFVMTLSITAIVFMICPEIARVLLISYVVMCSLISAAVACLYSLNNKNIKEGQII